DAMRLAPGWHIVLRGMGLLPGSLIVLFATLALSFLFKQLTRAEPDMHKIALLIAIPITIISALVAVIGVGLCSLVPLESKLRGWALGSTLACFFCLLSSVMASFLSLVLNQPGWSDTNPGLSGFVSIVRSVALVGFV